MKNLAKILPIICSMYLLVVYQGVDFGKYQAGEILSRDLFIDRATCKAAKQAVMVRTAKQTSRPSTHYAGVMKVSQYKAKCVKQ